MASIGLIFGGRSVEHRVSLESARTVAAGLREAGHEVVPLGIAQDGCWLPPDRSAEALAAGAVELPALGGTIRPSLRHLLDADVEVLFPLVHGTWGEDGILQGLCEMVDLPYVGAGVAPSALAMDKVLAKRVLSAAGLPVVRYAAFGRLQVEREPDRVRRRAASLGYPLFVKPAIGGSSVGIHRVESADCLSSSLADALRFDENVLVEQAADGRELECSVLGYRELEASAVGEIVPGNAFYDYADKYLQDTARLEAPADLSQSDADRLRRLAMAAFTALGGWGMARVDFFLPPDGDPLVNEINTVPGFTRISMFPRLWAESGLGLPELVDRLVAIAVERHRDRRELDAGIKGWLEGL